MEEYVWVSKMVNSPVFVSHSHPILERLARQYGVRITIAGPEDMADEPYLDAVRAAAARKVAGVMIVGWPCPGISEAVDAAMDSGVPVVTLDSDLPHSKRLAHAGTDWCRMGRAMADKLVELTGGSGKVLAVGMIESVNVKAGLRGFLTRMNESPDIEVLEPKDDTHVGSHQAERIAAEYLRSHADLAGIAALSGQSGPGAALAMEKAGKAGSVKLVCVDADWRQLAHIRTGAIDAALCQRREAFTCTAFQMLYDYNHGSIATGGQGGLVNIPGNVDTSHVVVTLDNFDTFESELHLDDTFHRHELSQKVGLLANIIESADQISLATDIHGQIVYANPAAARLTGYENAQLRTLSLDILFGLTDSQHDLISTCRTDARPVSFETQVVTSDGGALPVQLNVSPMLSGQAVSGMAVVATDLSNSHRARRALSQANEKLNNIIEFLPDPTFVIDREGKVIAWNRAVEKMTGVKKEQILGKGDYACGEAFYGKARPILIDLVGNDDLKLDGNYKIIRKKGHTLLVERLQPLADKSIEDCRRAIASPIFDAEGEMIGAVESIRGDSKWRETMKQLEASREADRSFRRRLQALNEVNRELVKAASPSQMCRKAVQLGRSRLGFERLGIWFVDPYEPNAFVGSYGIDEDGKLRNEEHARFVDKEGLLLGRVMASKLPAGFTEYCDLRDDRNRTVGRGMCAIAPLWDGRDVIGVMVADNLLSGQPISAEQTEILKLFASDVGHLYTRKQAEENVQRERQQLLSIFDSINEPIYISDPNTYELLYTNEAFKKHWGNVIGQKCHKTLQGLDAPCPFCTNEHIFGDKAGQAYVWEWQNKINKHWYRCMDKAIRWPDGRMVRYEMAIDITDLKQTELDLRREHDFSDTLIETAQVFVLVLDNDGRVVRMNTYAEEVTGYGMDELRGRSFVDILVDGPDRIHAREMLQATLSGGQMRGSIVPLVTKEGRVREIEWYDKSINDSSGECVGLVTIGLDITDRKRLEEQFRQAQKMEAIGTLAGGIAHDFNNQLTVIKGYSELLLSDLPKADPTRDHIEEIYKAAEEAEMLANQLLVFCRRQVLRPQVISVDRVLRDLAKPLDRIIGDQIKLSLQTDEGLGNIKADPTLVKQTIMNMVINSCAAMPDGGKVAIEAVNVDLDEGYVRRHLGAKSGQHVMLSVSDTGVGMDAKTSARVFEPFFTTKSVGEGTGLGLAMVYGFVKQSDGHITFESEPGKGTTFRIYLPRVEAVCKPDKPTFDKVATHGTETILAVENDQPILDLMVRFLRNGGFTVLEACSAEQALALSDQHDGPIDLLVTDVVMPGMDGRALAAELRDCRPGMPVVFITGSAQRADIARGLDRSCDKLLLKPFGPNELGRAVRSMLDKSVKTSI